MDWLDRLRSSLDWLRSSLDWLRSGLKRDLLRLRWDDPLRDLGRLRLRRSRNSLRLRLRLCG